MAKLFSMNKLSIGLITIILSLLLMTPNAAMSQTAVRPTGLGIEIWPYQISELGHLVWMAENVADSSGKYYIMTNDIDASATATWNDAGTDMTLLEGFEPIGIYSDLDDGSFRGIFDGGGHTITGLVINRPLSDYVGLFGCIGVEGSVRNLGLIGGSVTGNSEVGGLAGQLRCTTHLPQVYVTQLTQLFYELPLETLETYVKDVYTTGAVTGNTNVGGLIGQNFGTVANAYATGTVMGDENVGGLVGTVAATLMVESSGDGEVLNAYATGAVTGNTNVGGLAGQNYGSMASTYATGAITGNSKVGGLVGVNWGYALWSSYATGSVTGDSEVGGLVGHNRAFLFNVYATGSVTGDVSVGGLVGNNERSGIAQNAYCIGVVTGNVNVGGLVGLNLDSVTSSSYWDIQSSGLNTSADGTGKTTAEMKQLATFVDWDFTDVWTIDEDNAYPQLIPDNASFAAKYENFLENDNDDDSFVCLALGGPMLPMVLLMGLMLVRFEG